MTTLITTLSLLVLLLWILAAWQIWLGSKSVIDLARLPPEHNHALPTVSVVFSARNEARKIEQACRSILAIDYPNLEIIAVDDRSSDGTRKILEKLRCEYPQLRVIHINVLPPGWLGKTHGLQQGFEACSGDYVLFTDADVNFEPTTLRRVMPFVLREKLDHLCATPRIINAKPSLRCMMPAFTVAFFLNMRPSSINSENGKDAAGIGAFNLVHRPALEKIGGLEQVKLRPDEDVKLGKALRLSGARQWFADASGLLEVEWYQTAAEAIHGMEKNSFAFHEYSVLRVIAAFILALFSFIGPLAALFFTSGMILMVNSSSVLIATLIHGWFAQQMKIGALWGVLYPIGMLLMLFTILNSMIKVLRRQGVVWRETHYPLAELKKNRI